MYSHDRWFEKIILDSFGDLCPSHLLTYVMIKDASGTSRAHKLSHRDTVIHNRGLGLT